MGNVIAGKGAIVFQRTGSAGKRFRLHTIRFEVKVYYGRTVDFGSGVEKNRTGQLI